MRDLIRQVLREMVTKTKVICDECGWSWKLSEGGNDPYTCHECGHINQTNESEVEEYSRTLKNARQQGVGLRFPKSVIKNNPSRFRPYNREMVDESDPKVGTGKKPEGSDRRLYTDENPSDTVSVKFKTKEDIVDTLNKDSFKSKSHKRQSQIINLIHQRVRAAYQNASDPETKKRLKRGLDYIENEKEKSKEKTIRLQKEGETINRKNLDFFDLVNKGIIFVTEPFGDGKKQKSNWDGDSNIITLWNLKHPEQSQEWVFDAVKYPKPEAIQWWNDEGQFTLKDEKYHQILRSIELYNNSNKQEQNESELTERCWKGYTQKGMKTMFGKRYPNCVKIKK
jgi:hypothetical protein